MPAHASCRGANRANGAWRWQEVILLLVRCLLLACLIAWLADPVFPRRGDTVLVAEGTDAGWVERQLQDPPFKEAARLVLPAPDALAWLRAHEREFKPEARLLVLGDIPMPATRPQFRHPLTLRTLAKAQPPVEARVAIVSGRAQAWRRMFAALDGPMRVIVEPAPGLRTELIVWDMPDAPPPALRAPCGGPRTPAALPNWRKRNPWAASAMPRARAAASGHRRTGRRPTRRRRARCSRPGAACNTRPSPTPRRRWRSRRRQHRRSSTPAAPCAPS
ncbi:hypothetical protein [Massilia sp. Se16.2.3]|uniref:hypothetical protein n=1 Tax=Massilia sp. Se16.2.3 TaxID=2709303 RepID=UPI001E2B1A83|nr:hypothetical protein [Massilia sp. Se16.2.3]